MNLHEYQAKALFKEYAMPVPQSEVVASVDKVAAACKNLPTKNYVVKAQVHAGGRGKAGGVKVVSSAAEAEKFAAKLLGTNLVTIQTDATGQPINKVLIEEASEIELEFYLGAVLDRATQRVVVMASTEGGMEIEKVAEETPEKILKAVVNPLTQIMPYQCRELAFGLGLSGEGSKQFAKILTQMVKLFVEKDLALIEINPLVVTKDGNLICLDGKINVDENALYRQPAIEQMRDETQEDVRELEAQKWQLNYVALDGNIGCMVNGAGLAMATMDLVKLHGGEPANFLDVGGGATKERVSEAFKIILSDSSVKTVLVNIFGGIVRCDLIAEGIIAAAAEVKLEIPIVVRLEGNNAAKGTAMLNECDMNIIGAKSLTDAAKRAVVEANRS